MIRFDDPRFDHLKASKKVMRVGVAAAVMVSGSVAAFDKGIPVAALDKGAAVGFDKG